MASRRRSSAQLHLTEGIEAWYCPAARVRPKLRKILQYARFIDHPSDAAAARLIALEAQESLEGMERFVARWGAFWAMIYNARGMSAEDIAVAVKRLREEMRWTS